MTRVSYIIYGITSVVVVMSHFDHFDLIHALISK